jgi:hypothetical protein
VKLSEAITKRIKIPTIGNFEIELQGMGTNMTPELWQRLKPLFHATLQHGTESRAEFIEAACGEDFELENHLKQRLEAEPRNTGKLNAPLAHIEDLSDDKDGRFP